VLPATAPVSLGESSWVELLSTAVNSWVILASLAFMLAPPRGSVWTWARRVGLIGSATPRFAGWTFVDAVVPSFRLGPSARHTKDRGTHLTRG